MKRLAAALLGVAVTAAPAAHAADPGDDGPGAVPYRPSVSAPAALSAPSWLEVEAGVAHGHRAEGAHRQSVPYTFKLAFSPDWGVRIGREAFDERWGAARSLRRGAPEWSAFCGFTWTALRIFDATP